MSESFTGLTQCEYGRWYFMDGTELLPSIDEEKEINITLYGLYDRFSSILLGACSF